MGTILFNFGGSYKASPKDRNALRRSSLILNQRALQSRAAKKMRSSTRKLFQRQVNQAVRAVNEGALNVPNSMRTQWATQNAELWTPFLLAFVAQGERFFSSILGLKTNLDLYSKRVTERIINEAEDGIPFGSPEIREFILESATGSTRYMADLIDGHIIKEANRTIEIETTDAQGEPMIIEASPTPAQISKSLSELPVLRRLPSWRSTMLARTFTIWGYNQGALDTYKRAGVTQYEWLTAEDDMVCPYCRALDGRIIPVGGTFYNAGQQPTGVNDKGQDVRLSTLPFNVRFPPLHPGCRCTIIPVVNI